MNNKGLQNINKMYESLTYFDQYGASLILFIIITIALFILVSYCYAMIHIQPIIDDWPNQKCKPYVIPFAGFITKPDGVSALDYTAENFTNCTQSILSSITGYAVEPINFLINYLSNILNDVKDAINNIRSMFDKIREFFETMAKEVMGRILNMMIPLQQIIISLKDFMSKIQGVMTTSLFTLLGSYYTLKSFLGAIAQLVVEILVALAVMIVIFWLIPFTWGAAIANTAIFIAISIPLAIILVFMQDVLKVNTGLSVPSVPPSMKCFDKNTLITMHDGSQQKISDIQLGDELIENNEVTAIIKVETKGSQMYDLNGIIVSDSHIVKKGRKWIKVSEHPIAKKIDFYNEPYLYCLNTSSKTILINQYLFTDWDELLDDDILYIKHNILLLTKGLNVHKKNNIHKYLDGGFFGNTQINMQNGSSKEIKDIEIGDILEHGEKVYGIVIIDGKNLSEQYKYNLGNKYFEGSPNLTICDKNIDIITTLYFDNEKNNYYKEVNKDKQELLYHLLTDKNSFYVNNIKFYDYNASIDLFLEKNKGKLLSMKYV